MAHPHHPLEASNELFQIMFNQKKIAKNYHTAVESIKQIRKKKKEVKKQRL